MAVMAAAMRAMMVMVVTVAVVVLVVALSVAEARPAPTVTAGSMDFYVDVNGSDSANGSKTHPFRTLQHAQAAARAAAKQGAVNVFLNAGQFVLNSTLVFTPQDSGRSAAEPITYQSTSESEKARITSAVQITGWTKVGATKFGTLWQASLPEGVEYFRQLWVGGRRYHVVRQTTRQYAKADPHSIIFKPGQLEAKPKNLEDVYVVLYEAWTASLHQIASIDMNTRNITLKTRYNNKWSGGAAGSRFYLASLQEAFEVSSQFYVDRKQRTVTLCVNNHTNLNTETVSVPTQIELIRVQGNANTGAFVGNLHFRNLDIRFSAADVSNCFSGSCDAQSADFLTTAAFHVTGAEEIRLSGLTMGHLGGYGVWFDKGVFNASLTSSRVADLGAGGVRVGAGVHGVQPNPKLRTEHIVIANNVIEDGGHVFQEGCGVFAQLVANTVIQHNLIFNFTYTGVSLGWNWGYADTGSHDNLVAYNMIHDIGLSLLSDMGCVYTLGKQPGTKVVNNICHDIYSYNYGGWGLYTDEGSSYIQLYNNIVFHTKCAGVHQHYGTDNTFSNNVIAEVNTMTCDAALRSSQHPGKCNASAPDGACSSFAFDTNIVYVRDGAVFADRINTGFQNMTFDNNTYWKLDHTKIVFPEKKTFAQWKSEGKDVHSVVSDPMFEKPVLDDFSRLNPKSPALALGFKPINISNVGPVTFGDTSQHHHFIRSLVLEKHLGDVVVW